MNNYLKFLWIIIITYNVYSKVSGQDSRLSIEILNEYISLPECDSLNLLDTIYFEFDNPTNIKYVFAIPAEGLIFYNEPLKSSTIHSFDPFLGIGARLLDSNGKVIDVEHHRGFPSADFEFLPSKDIVFLPAKERYVFKVFLKFPFLETFGGFHQTFKNLEKAKHIEILFQPDASLLKVYLEKNEIFLRPSQKPLLYSKYFKLPVRIN